MRGPADAGALLSYFQYVYHLYCSLVKRVRSRPVRGTFTIQSKGGDNILNFLTVPLGKLNFESVSMKHFVSNVVEKSLDSKQNGV